MQTQVDLEQSAMEIVAATGDVVDSDDIRVEFS